MSDKIITFKKSVQTNDPLVLIDFLEKYSNLSKSILKKVLNNGGVWVRLFNNAKLARTRRATYELNSESYIEFYYDPKLTNMIIPVARELTKFRDWGLWYKPSGLLSQGTEFGDHCSILRQIEKTKNKAWLVHRLDREAQGLMLFAYSKAAAGIFSNLWQKHEIRKFYKVEVVGKILEDGEVNESLDGKNAKTTYTVLETNEHTTKLLAEIHTGRLHQIRRHFEFIGHPVLGDPKYGVGNKNSEGLRLMAYQLMFRDPITQKDINFQLPEKELGVEF
ncbi:MAG: RluA family pseudouridine synthase [Bacteriovorax sp.]|nr:RluA family pseudouridine synthase [Bacteriovorax sp.]